MKIQFVCILLIVYGFMGCTTLPPPQQQPKAMLFQQPFDDIWSKSVKILSVEHGLPIQVIEKDSGIIVTDWITFARPMTFEEMIPVIASGSFYRT